MKKIIPIVTLLVFLWFCGKQVVAHVVGVAIDIFLGYYVLLLLCNYVMERKGIDSQDELFERYKIIGVARIVLASFKEFGQEFYGLQKKIKRYVSGIKYIERNAINDKKQIMLKLIEILENTVDGDVCECIGYKELFESITNNKEKWNYYYHSRYVGNILSDIGRMCIKENVPMLNIMVKYSNGKVSGKYINFCKQENCGELDKFGINEEMNITDKEVQEYIKHVKQNLDKYKKMVHEIKTKEEEERVECKKNGN